MRKAPQYLTYFFIVISVQRVAVYLAESLHVSWLGWPFALGIAFGIYVGMYYQGEAITERYARQTAWMFIIVDLVYNEFEIINQLSAAELVTPDSNFLGIGHEWLTYGIQASAVLFGAIPTLAVAFLGRLQNAADQHWKGKLTNTQRIMNALTKSLSNVTGAIAIRFEAFAFGGSKGASQPSHGVPADDGQVIITATPKKWKQLTADDVAFISVNGRGQIANRYGISDGAAGNWKRDILAGKGPFQTAKKLPENAAK